MEAHAALVRPDGHAVLHAEGAVDLGLTPVIDPGDAELDGAVGLDQALQQAVLAVPGVLVQERPQRGHDLAHGLQELGLIRVAPLHGGQKFFKAGGGQSKFLHWCTRTKFAQS